MKESASLKRFSTCSIYNSLAYTKNKKVGEERWHNGECKCMWGVLGDKVGSTSLPIYHNSCFEFSHSSLEKFHSCIHRAWATWGGGCRRRRFLRGGSLVISFFYSNFLISFHIYGRGISSLFSSYQGGWKSRDFISRQLYQLSIFREFIREERRSSPGRSLFHQ